MRVRIVRPAVWALGVYLLSLGCFGTRHRNDGGALENPSTPTVEDISSSVETYLTRESEAFWKGWTTGAPMPPSVNAPGADLAETQRTLALLRDAKSKASADPTRVATIDRLIVFFATQSLASLPPVPTDETFESHGEKLPLAALDAILANTADGARRRKIFSDAGAALERRRSGQTARMQLLTTRASELGFPSLTSFAEAARNASAQRLEALADDVLLQSQDGWESLLDSLAKEELNQPRASLSAADLPRLFRPVFVDDAFPREKQVERLTRIAGSLGFELDAIDGFVFDSESRASKQSAPLALPVHVPDDVRLSIRPGGGYLGESTAMSELGRALAYAHVRAEQPYALTQLAPGLLGETSAVLFRDLLANRGYLEGTYKATGARRTRHLRVVSTYRLYELRRNAAIVLASVRATRDPAQWDSVVKSVYERALALPLDANAVRAFATEVDPLWAHAPRFEASVLAPMLAASLQQKYGNVWWTEREAGRFLESLWADGGASNATELASRLSTSGLSSQPALVNLGGELKILLLKRPASAQTEGTVP